MDINEDVANRPAPEVLRKFLLFIVFFDLLVTMSPLLRGGRGCVKHIELYVSHTPLPLSRGDFFRNTKDVP
jgi:hypothetical protein